MAEPVLLTEEQVLAQLQVRGFEEGYAGTPLRDFWGILTSITGEMRQGQSGSYLVALYNYDEVEVIESTEPYTSPIAQIQVSASVRAKSPMGYLGVSIDKIINAGLAPDVPQAEAKNMEYLKGKKLHMMYTPGHMVPRQREGQWNDEAVNCWIVAEISGEATTPAPAAKATKAAPAAPIVSASQEALAALDGKTVAQWHQVVMTLPAVKADTNFIQTIIDGSFVAGVEAAGSVTKDEAGVYTVV